MFKKLFYSLIILMSISTYAQTTPVNAGEITNIEQAQFTPVKSTPRASTIAPFEQSEHSKIDSFLATLIIGLILAVGIICFISLYNKATEDFD